MSNEVAVSNSKLVTKIKKLSSDIKNNSIALAIACAKYYEQAEDKPLATEKLMEYTQLSKASVSQLKKAGVFYCQNPEIQIDTVKAYLLCDLSKEEQTELVSKPVAYIRNHLKEKKVQQVQEAEVQEVEVQEAEAQEVEVQEAEAQEAEVQEAEVQEVEVQTRQQRALLHIIAVVNKVQFSNITKVYYREQLKVIKDILVKEGLMHVE